MMARAATPAEFVEEAEACFGRAAKAAGLHQRTFDLGGHRIEMQFAGTKLLDPMTRALAHCAARADGPAELRVCFFDTESTGTAMAPPAWSRDQYTGGGEIAGFCDERVETSYQPGWDVFQCLDRERKVALYWTPSWRLLPWWEVSFPLRVILHWWLRDTELQPVHAAAVGNADGGVLIAGPCGAGKSTTALSCLGSRLQYAGDDYTLARVEPAPYVHCLYNTAKLDPQGLERFPHLAASVANRDRLDREKAMLFLYESHPAALIGGFPVRAVVVPEVTGRRDTAVELAAQSLAMLALAPTTTRHLPAARARTVAKLIRLTKSAGCYKLLVGTDLAQIPMALTSLVERLNRDAAGG
jgi:hypothetical protein